MSSAPVAGIEHLARIGLRIATAPMRLTSRSSVTYSPVLNEFHTPDEPRRRLSSQRQIQSHWRVNARCEAKVLIERLCLVILGINQKGICADMGFGFEAAINGKANQRGA